MDSPNALERKLRAWASVFTVTAALAVAGLVVSWLADAPAYRFWFIVIASTSYVFAALGAGALRSHYGRLVLGALSLCWLGDFFGPGNFLLGVVFFLLAHLLLIPGFLLRGVSLRSLGASLVVSVFVTAVVTIYLSARIPPGERPFIYAYAAVIALMLGFAGGTLGAGSRGLIPVAALVFYVSDLFLAQTAFLGGGRIWTLTGYPLYYLACVLFAWTIAERRRKQSP
jgi:uncharacterized membrane protein YhhN